MKSDQSYRQSRNRRCRTCQLAATTILLAWILSNLKEERFHHHQRHLRKKKHLRYLKRVKYLVDREKKPNLVHIENTCSVKSSPRFGQRCHPTRRLSYHRRKREQKTNRNKDFPKSPGRKGNQTPFYWMYDLVVN